MAVLKAVTTDILMAEEMVAHLAVKLVVMMDSLTAEPMVC